MSFLRRWNLHPFLLSAFPVLALLAHNAAEIKPTLALRALILSFIGAVVLFLVLKKILGDAQKAAILCTLSLILFFSYGHVYEALKQTEVMGFLLGRHRVLVPTWILLMSFGSLWIIRGLRNTLPFTEALNVGAIVTIVFPIVQFLSYEIRIRQTPDNPIEEIASKLGLQLPEDQPPPDIYYLIFDAYTREDVLRDTYSFDNTPFIESMESKGFYIAHCSQSNYAHTMLSLSSSFNLNYLDQLGDGFVSGSTDRSLLTPMIKQSIVRLTLEELGYTVFAFETGYNWTQLEDADFYLTPSTSTIGKLEVAGGFNSFELMLLETSAGLLLTDAVSILPSFFADAVNYPRIRHRERVLFTLDLLSEISTSNVTPKFVFAHIVTPHRPFVLGPNGEEIPEPELSSFEDYLQPYRDQVVHVNKRIEQIADDILRNSATPPIIIIQGDHGPRYINNRDIMSILNGYYLPDGGNQMLYTSITPVNTFRLIFNQYFGGEFELLEDKSLYSPHDDPFTYFFIPNTSSSCDTQ